MSLNLLDADARRVLAVAEKPPAITPSSLVASNPTWNHRYAREVIGLCVTQGLLQLVETDDGDGWQLTARGVELVAEGGGVLTLDTNSQSVVQLSHTPATTKEHTMAKTQTAPKTDKPAAKVTTPKPKPEITFHKCACGCNGDVAGKSVFKQGHDARMISQLVAAVVGSDAQSARAKKVTPVVPPAFDKAQIDQATGPGDIQQRITDTAKNVTIHFGQALGAKFERAAMNGWNRENDRNTNASNKAAVKAARDKAAADKKAAREAKAAAKPEKAAKAPKLVTAKVGRFMREGHVTDDGAFLYLDAKGQEQVAAEGKYILQ